MITASKCGYWFFDDDMGEEPEVLLFSGGPL